MIRKSVVFACMVLIMTACASGKDKSRPVPPAPDVPKPGTLPPQTLAAGECGLFLWTQDTPRRFVFFSRAATGTASAMLQSSERSDLTLTAQRGDLFGQFMTEMDFVTATGQPVSLRLQPGESVEDGQKISAGRIELLDDGGWSTIIPIVGLRACQPDPE